MKNTIRGVVVATVLPFHNDQKIDWAGYSRVLDYCGAPDGIAGVFVNGHAGEGSSLAPEERSEVIEFTKKQLPSKVIIAGIIANSTAEAIGQARDARKAGADIGCIFPLPSLQRGGGNTNAVVKYVDTVHKESGLPLAVFQYPLSTGFGYDSERLLEMAMLPGVVMIKEGSGDVEVYEDNWRRIKASAPHVSVMGTSAGWLAAQLSIGADGILSGLASLAPHLLVDLWQAADKRDLSALREVNDRLHPLVRSIYGPAPKIDMHTRVKAALKHLGIIGSATPRAPLLPLSEDADAWVADAVSRIKVRDNLGSAL